MISLNETFIFILISRCLFKFITLFPIISENLSFKTTCFSTIGIYKNNKLHINPHIYSKLFLGLKPKNISFSFAVYSLSLMDLEQKSPCNYMDLKKVSSSISPKIKLHKNILAYVQKYKIFETVNE
jgi:hypothetical protein